MNNSPALLQFGDFELAASIIPSLIFLGYYVWPKIGAKWWQSPIGRMFVFSQMSLVLVAIIVVLSLYFGPDYIGRDWLRAIGYGLHFFAEVFVLTTYIRVRHDPTSMLPKLRADRDQAKRNAPTE